METSISAPIASDNPAVAPAWHTIAVLLILFGFAVAIARAGDLNPLGPGHGRAGGYVFAMIFEWAVVAFIWYGVQLRGFRLSDIVGGSWARPTYVLRDILVALGFLVISFAVLNGVDFFLKTAPNQAMRNLLPQSPIEIGLYLMLASTAGFCEETIFRGYLQRQFNALTGATAGGIVLQGLMFGSVHAYQGWKYVILITVLGSMLGLLAHWRRSLRPGMIFHFAQDGVVGLLAGHFMR